MNVKLVVQVTAKALLTAAASAYFHGTATGQEIDSAVNNEIVVEAPRSLPAPVERSPYTGAAIVVTTVRMPILYGDLNLADPADADRLMTRVDRVAHDACQHLDRLYPFNPDPDCVRRAVTNVTDAARAAIDAARK